MSMVEWGRFIAPVDAAAAMQYVKESLLSIHGRRSRLRAIAGAIPMAGRQVDREGHPAFALANAVAPDHGSQWVVLRDYAGLRQRSLVFFFGADGNLSTVVKTRPVSALGTSLRGECDALRAIRESVDDSLRCMMPEVKAFEVRGGSEVLVLSALPGRPLDISMQRSLRPRASHARHLAAAGAWLGRLHAATRDGSRTAVHGDYWTRNLLFEGKQLQGVVDWEGASPAGEPWEDVFTLPLLFATAAPTWWREKPLNEFRNAFTGRGTIGGALAGYFTAYSATAGVDQRSIRAAFEQYLFEHAARDRAEETAWKSRYSWSSMLQIVRGSGQSVFST